MHWSTLIIVIVMALASWLCLLGLRLAVLHQRISADDAKGYSLLWHLLAIFLAAFAHFQLASGAVDSHSLSQTLSLLTIVATALVGLSVNLYRLSVGGPPPG